MPVRRSRTDELTGILEERHDMNELRTRRPGALDGLARTLAGPLHRFVARLVGQEADAEDVVQQTFASVVSKIGAFHGGPADLRSWVFTIAYRASMDVLRGRNRAVALEGDVVDEPSELVDLETPPAELRKAFATLEAHDQYVLTLKYQDDFSNPEIAGILGLSANHVGVLLYRARQNLRKAIR